MVKKQPFLSNGIGATVVAKLNDIQNAMFKRAHERRAKMWYKEAKLEGFCDQSLMSNLVFIKLAGAAI